MKNKFASLLCKLILLCIVFCSHKLSAQPYSISGTVFEDKNYGGGLGRSLASSSGTVVPSARVELYTGANYTTFATTDASGNYSFTGLAAATYTIRVVNGTVNSSRTGTEVLPPVQTYRTDAGSGTAVAVTDHVGGQVPASVDAGNGSTTLAALTVGAVTPQSITTVVLGASNITGVDFGYSYNVIVNKNNTGQGSMRQFILNANALSNTGLAQTGLIAAIDNAVFMLADGTARAGLKAAYPTQFTAGIASITLVTALATISSPVILDASLQPGYSGVPIIEINGNAAVTTAGLAISAGSSTVRGFIINRVTGSAGKGISISASGGNTIAGNYIGTNAAGTAASANGETGINITSGNNIIGGTTAADRNIISGNTAYGIYLSNSTATGNVIKGNYIGTDMSGTAAIPNLDYGVAIVAGSNANTIGGTVAGAGNLISGNGNAAIPEAGIFMSGSSTNGNFVQGNYIGTDATGTSAIANTSAGILISAGAYNNTIGGTTALARNIISGNAVYGVHIEGSASTNNVVQGNYIGCNVTNTGSIAGHSTAGVNIATSTDDNAVGGTAAGAGNIITGSGGIGLVVSNGSTGNLIRSNLIYGNTGIGIDLVSVAAANNGTKTGTLAGTGMDSPVFTTVTLSGTTLTLAGYVGSAAGQVLFANASVDVFKADADASNYGEGEIFLGTLTANASGNLSGTIIVLSGLAVGDKITGTATDATNNTSEFGLNATVAGPPLKTWDGGAGTSNWGDANNWNPDGVPAATDDVNLTGAYTINTNVAAVANTLTLNHAGLTLTVSSGQSLTLSGGLTLTNGTLNIAASFPTVASTVNVAGGTVGFTAAGAQPIPVYNYNNLTLGTSGLKTFGAGTTRIAGTLTVSGTATADATTNSTMISFNGSGNQTMGPITYYNLDVTSTGGTVTMASSTVNNNFTTTSGAINIGVTTTVTVDGSFTNSAISQFVNDGAFAVKGTLTNHESGISAGSGTLTFSGSSAQSIAGTQPFKTYNLNTNNTASITLNNNLSVSGVHTFTAGDIISSATPNYLIYEAGSSYSGEADNRHVNGWVKKIGSTNFAFPVGNGTVLRKASIESLSGSLEFNCKYGAPTNNATNVQSPLILIDANEYWTINRVSGSGSAQVHLNWNNSKTTYPYYDLATIRVAYYTGGLWTNVGGSATGNVTTTGDITSNAVSSFGEFTFGSDDFYLSLKLNITAQRKQGFNLVEWQTTNESNTAYFEVERSGNSMQFEKIGTVASYNTATAKYSFKDVQPLQGTMWYRIKSADKDGKTIYSGIVQVSSTERASAFYVVNNPAYNVIHLSATDVYSGAYEYRLSNAAGQLIQKGTLPINGNVTSIPLVSSISTGTYLLEVKNAQYKFREKILIKK